MKDYMLHLIVMSVILISGTNPQSFLFFHDPVIFWSMPVQLNCWMPLLFRFVWCSLWLDSAYALGQEYYRSRAVFVSLYHISKHMMSICSIIGHNDFYHLFKWYLPTFSIVKFLVFSLQLESILKGDILILYKYPVSQ